MVNSVVSSLVSQSLRRAELAEERNDTRSAVVLYGDAIRAILGAIRGAVTIHLMFHVNGRSLMHANVYVCQRQGSLKRSARGFKGKLTNTSGAPWA